MGIELSRVCKNLYPKGVIQLSTRRSTGNMTLTIEVTKAAADQIRKSALESKLDDTPLRIAATRNADNSIHYGLGFDDIGSGKEKDHRFESNGVEIVVAESSLKLLRGTTIDFVEMAPKQFHFVFLNPNDPNYSPPTEE